MPHPVLRSKQAFPYMTPDDRAGTVAILGRLGNLGEDPETTQARQANTVLVTYAGTPRQGEGQSLNYVE